MIFDLDGTLADVEHRRHFIRDGKRDWPAFFRACVDDQPIEPVIAMHRMLTASGARVEIWSGRSDEVREETETWLARHIAPGTVVTRMRREGDYQPDNELKESWLLAEPRRPDLVFDDRDKVVAMWRRHGIRCAQVAPGDF